MKFRPAMQFDAAAIAALHAASWRFAYRDALSEEYLAGDIIADREVLWAQRLSNPSPRQYVVVAQQNEILSGFACAYLDEDPTWGSLLDNIHVSQNAHRQGLGSELLLSVARHCMTSSPDTGLYLWVLQSNVGAQAFYYSYGAENVGSDVWDAPGGTSVPRFRFAWKQARMCTLL